MPTTKVIITSPSLDPLHNVSGISAMTRVIIQSNPKKEYIHFELGRRDNDGKGISRWLKLRQRHREWKDLLAKEKEAVIHYNFPLNFAAVIRDGYFMYTARKMQHRMVVHLHGGAFLANLERAPWIAKKILQKIFSWNVPFITLGEKEEKILQEHFDCQKIFVLPNCVDLSEAQNFERTPNAHQPLHLGYLGRIAESKGMEYLLNACLLLKKMGVNYTLHIAGAEEGTNSYLPQFTELLKEQFVYHGVVDSTTKNDFLKQIDLFVLPSFFEGLPMALLECMSFGVVPITTNVGTIGEVVKEGENGIFIKIRDTESIVSAIKTLDEDRQFLQKLGQKAQDSIFRKFNPGTYIEQLNNIYEHC